MRGLGLGASGCVCLNVSVSNRIVNPVPGRRDRNLILFGQRFIRPATRCIVGFYPAHALRVGSGGWLPSVAALAAKVCFSEFLINERSLPAIRTASPLAFNRPQLVLWLQARSVSRPHQIVGVAVQLVGIFVPNVFKPARVGHKSPRHQHIHRESLRIPVTNCDRHFAAGQHIRFADCFSHQPLASIATYPSF